MRLLHALLLIPLFSAPVLAQTAPPPAAEQHGRRSAADHFADANTTHDGRLTLAQATAGYKSIAKSFTQIDVNRRGYVTVDDIKAWKAAKKAARQAARQAAATAGGAPRPAPAAARDPGPRASGNWTDMIVPSTLDSPQIGVDVPTAPLGLFHRS
ncbi:MAG: hypothetical protein EXR07_12845 [Acetobacteraceae bacterium]|nr:hypothetical protein [Acetobacteraceae bacterium]